MSVTLLLGGLAEVAPAAPPVATVTPPERMSGGLVIAESL